MYKYIFLLLFILSCEIETDVVTNSPDVHRTIEIKHNNNSVMQFPIMIGGKAQLVASYFENNSEVRSTLHFNWKSEDQSVAQINSSGLLTGIKSGQTYVAASLGEIESKLLVTVVNTDTAVSRVEITPISKTMFSIGDSIQLEAKAYNLSNVEITGKSIQWKTTDQSVTAISSSGLAKFVRNGSAEVRAEIDFVQSMPITFTVADMTDGKTGSFVGKTGHQVSGDVELVQSGDDLILMFKSNFSSQSGPNLFVTLASEEARYSNTDLEVASLNGNLSGARTYKIPNTNINTYKYVHIWCKPFNVVFGSAELK